MKRILDITLLLILLITSFSSIANELDDCFIEVWESEIYQPLECNTNVYDLIKTCLNDQELLEKSKVLFLLNIKNIFNLEERLSYRNIMNLPHSPSRNNYTKDWLFHVVLESEGKIYDLDFIAGPKIVEKEEYFKIMFPMRNSHYVLRQISAQDYSIEYNDLGERFSYGHFLLNRSEDYPAITFNQYINI